MRIYKVSEQGSKNYGKLVTIIPTLEKDYILVKGFKTLLYVKEDEPRQRALFPKSWLSPTNMYSLEKEISK